MPECLLDLCEHVLPPNTNNEYMIFVYWLHHTCDFVRLINIFTNIFSHGTAKFEGQCFILFYFIRCFILFSRAVIANYTMRYDSCHTIYIFGQFASFAVYSDRFTLLSAKEKTLSLSTREHNSRYIMYA